MDFSPVSTEYLGAAGTGKTQMLIDKVTGYVDAGVQTDDIIVFCATPQAARTFAKRLAASGVAGVRVTTVRQYALGVLADEEAIALTKRAPRLLSALERQIVMEDLNVSGLSSKKLKSMVRMFGKSWTELAPEKGDWLETVEELDIYELLERTLVFYQGMLEPEVAALAYRYLASSQAARAAHGVAHVLADDYQAMARASQKLAALVAAETLDVAGDRYACIEVYDSFPCAAGLEELVSDYPATQVVELAEGHRAVGGQALVDRFFENEYHALPWDAAADSTMPGVEARAFTSTTDEFIGVAAAVKQALAEGLEPDHVAVVTPNSVWTRNVGKALAMERIQPALFGQSPLGSIDLLHLEKCTNARALSLLDLLANPQDSMAWRCWCGYGAPLMCADVLFTLRRSGSKLGLTLYEALENFANGNPAGMEVPENTHGMMNVLEGFKAGKAILAGLAGTEGEQLLTLIDESLKAGMSAGFKRVALSGGATPAQMASAIRRACDEPTTMGEGVPILPYDQVLGLDARFVIVCGFVNGFIPTKRFLDPAKTTIDQQAKLAEIDARKVYTLSGKADSRLLFTYFTTASCEDAARLELKVGRIRMRNGERVCELSPGAYLSKLVAQD